MGQQGFTSYAEFWLHYLREHGRGSTRFLHYAGTSLALACAIALFATGQALWAVLMPVAGYGFAWFAHLTLEKNRPASFTHPVWSLASDFRMLFLAITGRLGPHLERAAIDRRR